MCSLETPSLMSHQEAALMVGKFWWGILPAGIAVPSMRRGFTKEGQGRVFIPLILIKFPDFPVTGHLHLRVCLSSGRPCIRCGRQYGVARATGSDDAHVGVNDGSTTYELSPYPHHPLSLPRSFQTHKVGYGEYLGSWLLWSSHEKMHRRQWRRCPTHSLHIEELQSPATRDCLFLN